MREFLEALLNRKIQDEDMVKLTSAQVARFAMWAGRNGLDLDLSRIKQEFTLNSLTASSQNAERSLTSVTKLNQVQKPGIVRIGNDIQSIEELFPEAEQLSSIKLDEIFTSYETSYANNMDNPKATLTGIFSLKESLVKAGASYSTYLDLEITHNSDGAPVFSGFTVSISHSGDYATSVALKIG